MNGRAQDLADSATAIARRSADKLTDAAGSVEGSLRDGAGSLRSAAERSAGEARRLVNANPFVSIAIAAVAGGVLAWLMKRR